MSNQTPLSVLAGLVVLLLSLTVSPYVLAEPLKLATSSWPPYIGRDLPNQGMAVDIVTKAFEDAGIETSVVMLPTWAQVREGVEAGVYDVILGYWYSDERARFHLYSDPFIVNRLNFIKRRNSPTTFQSLDDIEGLMVATVQDYAYGNDFESHPGIYQVKSNHVIQALLTLMEGRADLALGDFWVMRHELKSYMPSKLKELEVLPKPLAEKGLHITVSLYNKNGPSIIAAFNEKITVMKQNGELEQIVKTHQQYYE